MNELILIDTDILIDSARKDSKAVAFIDKAVSMYTLTISAVTQMELLVGCRNKDEIIALDRFLGRFNIARINEQISDNATSLLKKYRLSHGLLIPDALIASTTLQINAFLATKNIKDYRFIEGLNLWKY